MRTNQQTSRHGGRQHGSHPVLVLALLLALALAAGWLYTAAAEGEIALPSLFSRHREPPEMPDWVTVDLLTVNEYSRPGIGLETVNGIVIHYVGNPGTTAQANRNYFESLAESGETHASSHFVIGLEGEIIQCVPLDEIAYCSNDRNSDTISIECCHPGEDGAFTQETYASLVKLVAFLADYYDLGRDQVIRHYDVTGKLCPLYYVKHEDAWEQFKDDVFGT
ncbi:MAG: peptidoglycan recognition protein family protein [Clostridiales bacterium]|nr:peptidoglycan recognition protein family protein [Clostridiales bacterium]